MTNVYTIAHHAPRTGYFVGSFSLRGPRGPATLRGPFDEIASAIRRCPESTVYQFDAFAENWRPHARQNVPNLGADEQIVDLPWIEREGPPLEFAAHPSTVDRMMDLAPEIDAAGEALSEPSIERVIATPNLHRFRLTWNAGKLVCATAIADVDARFPWVRWTISVRRRDAQHGGTATIRWPWKLCQRQLKFGSLNALRVLCVTAQDPTEIEQRAIRNMTVDSYDGPVWTAWHGIPHDWNGDFLGQPIVRGPRELAVRIAGESWSGMQLGGRVNPNAPGVDPTFGTTWTAPLWPTEGLPDPRVLTALREGATVYAMRPCHWLEPDTTRRLDPWSEHAGLTLHKGQPYDRKEADELEIGRQYRSDIDSAWGTFDHEHRSVAPLATYLALTGDPLAEMSVDSMLSAETYERSVLMAWMQAGRGNGLPWIAGSLLARVTGDASLVVAWNQHSDERLRQLRDKRLQGFPISVAGTYLRGSPWLDSSGNEAPYSDPYEQATIVVALWLEHRRTGIREFAQLALELGRGVVAGHYRDSDGIARAAYNMRWLGGAWPHKPGEAIHDDLRPGGDALSRWAGSGLHAYLLAGDALGITDAQEPWRVEARELIRDLARGAEELPPGEWLAAWHRGWLGVAPPAPIA